MKRLSVNPSIARRIPEDSDRYQESHPGDRLRRLAGIFRPSWGVLRPVAILSLLSLCLGGCITTSVSDVWSDPDFDWDSLKRHRILMTPLLDLRPNQEGGAFFKEKEQRNYAEQFKQQFFKLRTDIRVFGAGGAFESLAALPGLPAMARKVIAREPLSPEEVATVGKGTQEIRYVWFFAMTRESLDRDVSYVFREKEKTDLITYESTRRFDVKLAMWDAQENRTVWIGTQKLTPTASNTVEVVNPYKRKKIRKIKGQKKTEVYYVGRSLDVSLSSELRRNPERFPGYPGREPDLTGTFDDYALALPINPEEAKLIEYSYFTYHRPLFVLHYSQLGSEGVYQGEFGLSSVINYRHRFGGAFGVAFNGPTFEFEGEDWSVGSAFFGLTYDMEWNPSPRVRLLTGVMAGGAAFSISPEDDPVDTDDGTGAGTTADEEELNRERSDGTVFLWPRARMLLGAKDGFQWGAGLSYRWYKGIEEQILRDNMPSPWSASLFCGFAFRGF